MIDDLSIDGVIGDWGIASSLVHLGGNMMRDRSRAVSMPNAVMSP
jgi:hypothetical protein